MIHTRLFFFLYSGSVSSVFDDCTSFGCGDRKDSMQFFYCLFRGLCRVVHEPGGALTCSVPHVLCHTSVVLRNLEKHVHLHFLI